MMKIKEITIENFKSYKGKHVASIDKNLCFLVGNNNCGKSTLFEAIDFLKSGIPKGKSVEDVRNINSRDSVTVQIKFTGNIKQTISEFSEAKYLQYVFEEDDSETIILRRSSKESEITQNGKSVNLDIKKITVWNNESQQFENPTGFDKAISSLFATQFIWANTNPDDVADFGATKICGQLINAAIGDFFNTEQWKAFAKIFDKTFVSGDDCLSLRTIALKENVQRILNDQFGDATVNFNFSLPDTNSFIKTGNISINDGIETDSKEKGSGMQRALAIALIQVYADEICKNGNSLTSKPLFLFLDEPETFLHPQAQAKLLKSLSTISGSQQVFITTHSPFLLRSYNKLTNELLVFKKNEQGSEFEQSNALNLFGNSSPTWGEIIYCAYGIANVEFHNELYGFIQAKAIAMDQNNQSEKNFDDFLANNNICKSKMWIREYKGTLKEPIPVTLQTYIRNIIHHPENTHNQLYTDIELNRSIVELVGLLTTLNCQDMDI